MTEFPLLDRKIFLKLCVACLCGCGQVGLPFTTEEELQIYMLEHGRNSFQAIKRVSDQEINSFAAYWVPSTNY